MNLMGLFRSPQNELEKGGKEAEDAGIRNACPHCGALVALSDQQENLNVCPACGYHIRIGPRERIAYLTDEDSFSELDGSLMSKDVLGFPGYDQKLRNAKLASREKEGVVCGRRQNRRGALRPVRDGPQLHDGQHGHRGGGEDRPPV